MRGVLGILGGGQLGRMMAAAASRLGISCCVWSEQAGAPALALSSCGIVAPFDDEEAQRRFLERSDVITAEFENVPLALLESLSSLCPLYPRPEIWKIAQSRAREKRVARQFGLGVVPHVVLAHEGDLERGRDFTYPAILKTDRLGYDGKSQIRLARFDELAAAFASLGGVACVLEAQIDFMGEFSVIIARRSDGEFVCFPSSDNVHEGGILRSSSVPSVLPSACLEAARVRVEALAEGLDLTGLLAVEFFALGSGGDASFLFNELAPRPHNSGHWTLDCAATCQFEQLVRAVFGLALGDVSLLCSGRMVNLLGAEIDKADDLLGLADHRVHVYGKGEARFGRKMGHYCVVGSAVGGR